MEQQFLRYFDPIDHNHFHRPSEEETKIYLESAMEDAATFSEEGNLIEMARSLSQVFQYSCQLADIADSEEVA